MFVIVFLEIAYPQLRKKGLPTFHNVRLSFLTREVRSYIDFSKPHMKMVILKPGAVVTFCDLHYILLYNAPIVALAHYNNF